MTEELEELIHNRGSDLNSGNDSDITSYRRVTKIKQNYSVHVYS